MTYPSQPGYPTPQYGGQPPQPPQQNNLWLIGGAVLTVLIIIMTVILLVVQRTHDSNSSDGGNDGGGSGEQTDGGGDDNSGGNDGGDDGGSDGGSSGAVELTSEACDAFDFSKFEEAFGPIDPDQTSRTETSSNGLGSLSCSFYNEEVTGINLRISDYETVDEVVDWVESDAEYYTAADGYDFQEYTEFGDAGSLYTTTTEGTKTVTLHVAVGSLDVNVYTTLWEGEGIDEAAATAALEDMVAQCGDLFADYT